MTDTVAGVNPNANRLSAIGVSVTANGRLVLNRTRLEDVVNGRVPEISDRDLSRLFSFSGDSTNANVTFLGGSTRTTDGVEIEVDVTQAATQGSITATNGLTGLTTIDGTNDSFTIEVDSGSATVTLTHGDYTDDDLASLVQDALNSSSELSGRSVSVGLSGSSLRIISETYGRASELTGLTGSALSALGFDGTETGQGQDVVGQFVIDGVTEEAIGRGRLLTGNADNTHTADLQISVTLSDAQVVAGTDASVTLTRGVGSRLDTIIGRLVDPVSGRVKNANDAFDSQIEDIQSSIDKQNKLFELKREQLIAEFVALESAVSQLQSQSSFLAAQLGGVAQTSSLR